MPRRRARPWSRRPHRSPCGHPASGRRGAPSTASSSPGKARLIQTANRVGAVPAAVTRTRDKRQRLQDAGAAEVIVSAGEDMTGRLLEVTGGRGTEYVFDTVAGPGVVDPARGVAPGGTCSCGAHRADGPRPTPGSTWACPP
ncbi:zinc-binding dehydrogenase [Streptomyces sp. NPDC058746]|uniref:zinc-binding dehydrogenase n=1 Tax=Streptomyces sp. NPDC058746 TaxID=3346622 RepID=UPI0036899316